MSSYKCKPWLSNVPQRNGLQQLIKVNFTNPTDFDIYLDVIVLLII